MVGVLGLIFLKHLLTKLLHNKFRGVEQNENRELVSLFYVPKLVTYYYKLLFSFVYNILIPENLNKNT